MTQSEIYQTKKKIEDLRQQQLKMNEVIAEFHTEGSFTVKNNDFVQVAPVNITEADGLQLMAEDDPFGKLETSFHADDPFKAFNDSSRKEDISKVEDSKEQAAISFQKSQDSSSKVEDIFQQEDFFSEFTEPVKKSEDSFDSGFNGFSSDPFGSEDPFKEDPFKDCGIIETTPSDPFGEDPFQEELIGKKESNKGDPFESFPNDAGTTDVTDLFDPFGLSNTSSSVTVEDKFHEEYDPFGTDPFSAFSVQRVLFLLFLLENLRHHLPNQYHPNMGLMLQLLQLHKKTFKMNLKTTCLHWHPKAKTSKEVYLTHLIHC
ncbi:uncharacterized protein LOC143223359 [Tachypleus tridentatus]|uniref:uncharacterized protein LOC143223359 n=1 Tax=Tachypleus tridentatus TaxID=6853 RepID=UPI003FD1BF54